jgi:carbon-monoxide dehydrogenase medium subunit
MTKLNLLKAKTLDEVFRLTKKVKGRIYFLAGGTDLIVLRRDGLVPDSTWIDIGDIARLKGIKETRKEIAIGAGTTFARIAKDPLIAKYAPALKAAALTIGSPQIRNRATIGGNIANASPAADSLPVLYAQNASLVLGNGNDRRSCSIEDFFTGFKRTGLKRRELILHITLPKVEGLKGAFQKLGPRKALAISKISLALCARISARRISTIGIGLGAVGITVLRAKRTEAFLKGKELSGDIIARASRIILEESSPIDDFRSTASYRRTMTGVLLKRILKNL